jgi:pyruvate/2-oxoglutarate dehydrogenase complex dihydrolipoamide acyltransferase (E2) component
MAFVFDMPEVGEGVVEAEIADWKVAVGDTVRVDQPLCEITTDKASLEITSPKAGVILRLHGKPGDIIQVHKPLVEIDTDGAPAKAEPPKAEPPKAEPPKPGGPPRAAAPSYPTPAAGRAPTPAPRPADVPAPIAPTAGVISDPGTRGATRATPAVRRHAHELDVDVQAIPGSGPEGRVTHEDVDAYVTGKVEAAPIPVVDAVAPVALPQVAPSGAETRIPIVGVRRRIAERMVASKRTAPHFTYVEEVDCEELVALRSKLKPRAEKLGVQLTYMPFFAKACSIAFRDFPNVNAVMDEERSELVVKGDHHMGFACDTPSGLMVPVIRSVEQKSILQIAADMQELFARTRAGQAKREDLVGSSFTVTSVGSIGGVLATPILNTPEVAILGLNQIRKRAVVNDEDQVVVRHMTYLSPSFDHRIIDGAVAARFVARLKELLEHPELLLLHLV